MSKISIEGYEQVLVIRNALNSIHDKLSGNTFYVKNDTKKLKNIEEQFIQTNVFSTVQEEFQGIAEIIEQVGTWEEVE